MAMPVRSPSSRRISTRILLPFLAVPITAGAFAPPPEFDLERARVERSIVLHPISRSIERSDQWHVVARYERPREREWALVAWHDGPIRPGQIDPSEIMVLEQNSISDALIATTFYEESGPCDPLETTCVADEGFLNALRHDIRYCSRAVGSAEDPRAVSVVRAMLNRRVRELDEPRVSLTSTFE